MYHEQSMNPASADDSLGWSVHPPHAVRVAADRTRGLIAVQITDLSGGGSGEAARRGAPLAAGAAAVRRHRILGAPHLAVRRAARKRGGRPPRRLVNGRGAAVAVLHSPLPGGRSVRHRPAVRLPQVGAVADDVAHGTHAGYRRHQRSRQTGRSGDWGCPPCVPCQVAHRNCLRQHRRRKRNR